MKRKQRGWDLSYWGNPNEALAGMLVVMLGAILGGEVWKRWGAELQAFAMWVGWR